MNRFKLDLVGCAIVVWFVGGSVAFWGWVLWVVTK
jgi:hypothetical protein